MSVTNDFRFPLFYLFKTKSALTFLWHRRRLLRDRAHIRHMAQNTFFAVRLFNSSWMWIYGRVTKSRFTFFYLGTLYLDLSGISCLSLSVVNRRNIAASI